MAISRVNTGDGVYQKTTLRNGLRVISERTPSVHSVSLGVWVDVGSRYEKPDERGVSHLLEHMLFKGTKNRNAREIASSLESIGGALNAFTSRENTCFTARILDEHLPIAVEVLADLTCNATLTAANLKREKLVIFEEIKESLDNPSDHIHDFFAETFWGEHPLGQPILGSIESLASMPRSRMTSFVKRQYRAGSIVIAACGAVSHRRLVKLVREAFDFAPGEADEALAASREEQITVSVKPLDNDQTHLCVGYPGYPYASRRKMPVLVLSTYLGGGMSSVLFQKVREARGLAYTTYAYHDSYRDAGVFGIYLATDRQRLAEAYSIVRREVGAVRRRKLDPERLDQVKQQLKGQLILGMESTATRMSRLARLELLTGEYAPIRRTMREIDAVTPSKLLDTANEVLDDSRIAIAALGATDTSAFGDTA